MDEQSPLNLTDEELLEVRKLALQLATSLQIANPGAGVVPMAIMLERFMVFGDAGESK